MIHNEMLKPVEIRFPTEPEPIEFAFDEAVDEDLLRWARRSGDPSAVHQLFERLKQKAAHKLAQHIAQHCKWFEAKHLGSPDLRLRLQLTIADRGAYENWIPFAEERGRQEGWKKAMRACTESLPYGLADVATEFYE